MVRRPRSARIIGIGKLEPLIILKPADFESLPDWIPPYKLLEKKELPQ